MRPAKDKDNETIGIVMLNLGGPDSLQAIRPFLYNLFSDRDIIRLGPSFLQKPIAWMISTLRSKKTSAMYSRIGGKSPILDITMAQAAALEKELNKEEPQAFKVYLGMRYWHPFMKETVNKILKDGIRKLIVFSLYPHYSKATTWSSVDDFKRAIKGNDINIDYIEEWYDFPPYIDALAENVAKGISKSVRDKFELLYSAHSLPQSFIDEGDPYLDHIKKTIEKINERLTEAPYNLTGLKWHLSFQSKVGPVKWLEPAIGDTIEARAREGCRNLLVVPISFVSDHIETLYEIDIQYKKLAEEKGISLKRSESLNTSEKFIFALKELIMQKGNV